MATETTAFLVGAASVGVTDLGLDDMVVLLLLALALQGNPLLLGVVKSCAASCTLILLFGRWSWVGEVGEEGKRQFVSETERDWLDLNGNACWRQEKHDGAITWVAS